MAVQNLEVTTESILSAVSQMPEKEFENFIEKAKRLHKQPKKSVWTKQQIELIKKLNAFVLSPEEQTKFNKLVRKRRSEKITESELEELIELNEKSESLNIERLKILAKLAESKKKTLSEIMDDLEIIPPKII
ncbi:hypothetical protein BH20ACI1_BH20ACI1_10340 [soil metagenome]